MKAHYCDDAGTETFCGAPMLVGRIPDAAAEVLGVCRRCRRVEQRQRGLIDFELFHAVMRITSDERLDA